uniref:G_PROTEIN_RECEP_F1_2 domain-containing protein n=1 Tax=Strongyloides papillosus TaxID=174720 RepID=A0A0N5BCI7_STREA
MEIPLADGISLIIQIMCYILYILLAISFIFKLLREKQRDYDTTTFLYHFIANTFFDILQSLAVIIFQKFLHWKILVPHYLSSKFLPIIYGSTIYGSILGSVLGSLITVVNRYCALYHVVFFKTFWTKTMCLKLIFLQFMLPILLFSFNFFYTSKVVYVPSYDCYIFFVINEVASMMNNVILSIVTFICSVISIVLNVVILRKYTQVMKNAPRNERSKRLLMFLYMAVTTICLLALSIEQFVRLYFGILEDKERIYFFSFVLYWIIPIFTITQPIVTLIMSRSLRRFFLSFYFNILLPEQYRISKSITVKTSIAAIKLNKISKVVKTNVENN